MNPRAFLSLVFTVLLLTSCAAAPEIQPGFNPARLKPGGGKFFAIANPIRTL